jgi:hypothetical protein
MKPCEKKKFPSKEDALIRLEEIKTGKGNPERKGNLKRVYFCSECKSWHLTSMSNKEHQNIKIKHRIFENDKYGDIANEFRKKNNWNKKEKVNKYKRKTIKKNETK